MGLIKADDLMARRARPAEIRVPVLASAVTPPAAPVVDPVRIALEQEVEALREDLEAAEQAKAELAAELGARDTAAAEAATAHEEALAEAVAEAEARGHEAGLAKGAEAKAEALGVLEAAAERALDQLRGDLRATETLAVALAKAALAKVFGDDADMSRRVTRLVRRQMEALDRSAVLRIEVAAVTFADPADLDALRSDAGLEGIELSALDDLSAGDCRIRLRLGELEVGLGQQWGRLTALLDEALAPEDRP